MIVMALVALLVEGDFVQDVYYAALEACSGSTDRAAALYAQAFQGRMSSPNALAAGVLLYKIRHEYTRVLMLCSGTGAARRSDTVNYWCGRVMWELGRKKAAARRFEQALALGGDRPWYLAAAAYVHARLGMYSKATKELARLVSRSPWLIDSWLWPSDRLGMALLTNDLLSVLPEGERASAAAAVALACQAYDYALLRARASYEAGHRDPVLYEVLAKAYGAAYDQGNAERFINEGLAAYPDNVPLNFLRARRLASLGRWRQAAQTIERILPRDPGNVELLSSLGVWWLRAGDRAKARRYLAYATDRGADSAAVLRAMAKLERLAGRPGKAEELLRRCLVRHPVALKCAAELAVVDPRIKRLYARLERFQKGVKAREERLKLVFLGLKDALLGRAKVCPAQARIPCLAIALSRKFSKSRARTLLSRLARLDLLRPDGLTAVRQKDGDLHYSRVFFNALPVFLK